MHVELRKLSTIRPYENNPRNNRHAVDAVARSIQEFGFRQPIVVDTDGVIVCGHTRYQAALKLGLDEVPVHVARDLTPEQIRAYRLADNKTASLSTWNFALLAQELEALREADYDLGITGFLAKEIDLVLNTPKDQSARQERPGMPESIWAVVIQCASEEEQRAVYTRLVEEGFQCRLLIA